jgi:hypothetical protein
MGALLLKVRLFVLPLPTQLCFALLCLARPLGGGVYFLILILPDFSYPLREMRSLGEWGVIFLKNGE